MDAGLDDPFSERNNVEIRIELTQCHTDPVIVQTLHHIFFQLGDADVDCRIPTRNETSFLSLKIEDEQVNFE